MSYFCLPAPLFCLHSDIVMQCGKCLLLFDQIAELVVTMANIYFWAGILLWTQTYKHPCIPNVPFLSNPKLWCGRLSREGPCQLTKAYFSFIKKICFVSVKFCPFLPMALRWVLPLLKTGCINVVTFLTHVHRKALRAGRKSKHVDFSAEEKKNKLLLFR